MVVGGDKSVALLDNHAPFTCDMNYASVELPSLLYVRVIQPALYSGMWRKGFCDTDFSEDEWFNEETYFEPSEEAKSKTSSLSGFYYVSKCYQSAS